jgi:hypothetical protein
VRTDTVAILADDYLKKYARKFKRSASEDERILDVEVPRWRDRSVRELTRRDVRALVERIAERAPLMGNRVLAVVRKMLNFAVDHDWIDANPAAPPGGSILSHRSPHPASNEAIWYGSSTPRESPHIVKLTVRERAHLEALARKYTSPYRDVLRAKIVLMAAAGLSNTRIAERLDTKRQIVSKWRRRFCLHRLLGLQERPRHGRPRNQNRRRTS